MLDIGQGLFANPVLAYGLVFSLQAVGMMAAIGLLNRVNLQEFRTDAKTAIATVFQGDLDWNTVGFNSQVLGEAFKAKFF